MKPREEEEKGQSRELQEFVGDKHVNVHSAEQSHAIEFDWRNKWLKGNEYHHILTHAELYIRVYEFGKYPMKAHPSSTYSNPISNFPQHLDGSIYFVEGLTIGSDFGFPRTNIKKQYKW